MKRFLLLKTGDTLETVKARAGDFDRMFLRALADVDVRVIQAHKNEPLPSTADFDALIVTGSPFSVTAREPWADRAGAFMKEALDAEKHILGVCYGHQLLAHAIGGVVAKNPNGYEVGTIEVSLTPQGVDDRLIGALDRPLFFQSTHSDAVMSLPPTARVLASNASTPIQAFGVGDRAWGVQFHPEFDQEIMRLYVEGRKPLITSDVEKRGLDPSAQIDRAFASVRETPAGRALLRRFVETVG